MKDSEEYQRVNYLGLIPILVKAFQEQNASIIELKNKLLEQEIKIKNLEENTYL
jgi:hypothetical protein